MIANPRGLDLRLDAVVGDHRVPIATLGRQGQPDLEVVPGAYVVRAELADAAIEVPAPLFAASLPADRTVRVTITPPPPADPDFAWIPMGPALVGDVLGVGQEDERPARLVELPGFWLGRREVTNAEFAAFLAAATTTDPAWCAFDSGKFRIARDPETGRWSTDAPRAPVVTVSLAGARAYAAYLTARTGQTHRLPSENEWEKAARGPESFVFAYGNTYRRGAANQESGTLCDVGAFAPNGFGLFDMTGNAFEWTNDVYPAGHTTGIPDQVLRGGSFVLDGMYLRNSFRMRQRPSVRTDDIGFRVVRETVPAGGRR